MGDTTSLQCFEEVFGLEPGHNGPPERDGRGIRLNLVEGLFTADLSIQDIGSDLGFLLKPMGSGVVEVCSENQLSSPKE